MQPMIEQIEIFPEILTVYFNCKYFSFYFVPPLDFTQASVKRVFMHIFLGSVSFMNLYVEVMKTFHELE